MARRRPVLCVLLAYLVACALWFVPSGYFAFLPGEALALKSMVSVEGATSSGKGAFYLTTIRAKEANIYTYLLSYFDSSISLLTRDEYLPIGMDIAEYNRYSKSLMDESQALAVVMGLTEAGLTATFTGQGVRVVEVMNDGPASGRLLEGDVIISVDGHETRVSEDFTKAMTTTPVGTPVVLTIMRGDQVLDIPLTTTEHPTVQGRSAVRIRIETFSPSYDASVRVTIDAGTITGPSAGLMFALEVLNQAAPDRNLTRGCKVAGTGTISPSGKIGAIGGVVQKVVAAERAGAAYFLVPTANAAEAQGVARKIRVVAVDTLDGAIRFLESLECCLGTNLDNSMPAIYNLISA